MIGLVIARVETTTVDAEVTYCQLNQTNLKVTDDENYYLRLGFDDNSVTTKGTDEGLEKPKKES